MIAMVGRTVVLIVISLSVGIQTGAAQNPIVEQLRVHWEASRKQMLPVADAMPADKFQYKPPQEERNFGEIIAHLAGENMLRMEMLAGVPKPGSKERFQNLKTREELLKALSDLYDYGAKVLARLNDQKATESIPFIVGRSQRWVIVEQAIGHSKEHYGTMITYLRMNGISPPIRAHGAY